MSVIAGASCAGYGFGTSTAAILVLFILIVIIQDRSFGSQTLPIAQKGVPTRLGKETPIFR